MFEPKRSDETSAPDVDRHPKIKREIAVKKKQKLKNKLTTSTSKASVDHPGKKGRSTSDPGANMPTGKLDKLVLMLHQALVSDFDLEHGGRRLQAIKDVKKISSKGESYKNIYVLRCPSGVKAVFALIATAPQIVHSAKITLNPDKMTEEDTIAFGHALKQLFLLNAKATIANMVLDRADHAYDHPVHTRNLIVQLVGFPSEQKFFVKTGVDGHIQSWYCGSLESRIHWAIYDQVASDAYKIAHGELPSRRPKARDDAELMIEHNRRTAMTRFEARRVFKKPTTLRETDAMQHQQPLGHFIVYLVNDAKLASAPAGFSSHLDSIRLRGVAGADKYYREHHPGRAGNAQLAEYNQFLQGCVAPFWPSSGLDASIENALSKLPVWKVLKYLAPAAAPTEQK